MKLTIKPPTATQRRRTHPFFAVGITLGIILLLAGTLLGLRSILAAHADSQQTSGDDYVCSDGGHSTDGSWNHQNGNGNATANGQQRAINSYTGPDGDATNGTFANPDNHCNGWFSWGWDNQSLAWTWSAVVPHWPAGTLCTSSVWIPSWYAGAANARYTLDNGSNLGPGLSKSVTATLNQEPIESAKANTGFVNPWALEKSPDAAGIPGGDGKTDVTLTMTLHSSGSTKYLAADAVDFHCTTPTSIPISTPPSALISSPTPTPASGQGNQTMTITFNNTPITLINGQAQLSVNGQPAWLTFDGQNLTLSSTDRQSTISATATGGSISSQGMINGQTVTIQVQGNTVTISTPMATSTPTATDPAALPAGAISMLVPAYWGDDETSWNMLDQYHLPGTIAIVNINNGPGDLNAPVDNQLASEIQTAQSAGIRVIGYVLTGNSTNGNFTTFSVSTVEANIDAWYTHYALDGILLDNARYTSENLPFYQTLHDYIKGEQNHIQQASVRNTIVFINGSKVPETEGYTQAADILSLFEDDVTNYHLQVPDWIKNYPASKFAITVTGPTLTSTQVMDQVITSGIQQNVGYYYFHETDQGYTQFPAIWNEEYTELSKYNKPVSGTGITSISSVPFLL